MFMKIKLLLNVSDRNVLILTIVNNGDRLSFKVIRQNCIVVALSLAFLKNQRFSFVLITIS